MPPSQAAVSLPFPLPNQTFLPNKQPLQPWHWRSSPLNHRTGSDVFAALYLDPQTMRPEDAIATLLESPAPSPTQPLSNIPDHQHPRYSICAGASRVIEGVSQHWTPTMGHHLATLRHLMERSPYQSAELGSSGLGSSGLGSAGLGSAEVGSSGVTQVPAHLPFHGGWLGWLGYDVAWEIEVLPEKNTDPLPFPVSFWYEPATFAVLDHQEQRLWLAATHPADLNALSDRLAVTPLPKRPNAQTPQLLNSPTPNSPTPNSPTPQLPLTFLSNQQDYEQVVQQAKAHIQAGDIFQANLSLRFSTQTAAPSWMIYQSLQQVNPSPFSSYWHTPWGDVVSCSPERLVKVREQVAETRPIAGTRPRGSSVEADLAYEEDLTRNRKENAEHIMLVDLERNDLGRVCQWGTVKVDELLTIERYSHVMHLVSNVVGILDTNHSVVDVIQALFPGGTITGCPKVRCMEIIEALEPVRRSLFYGSCGYLDQRGVLDLNILIRTLLCERLPAHPPAQQDDRPLNHPSNSLRTVWGQVGAGIVADSDPTREWLESLNKAKAQLDALELAHQVPNF